MVQWQSKNSVDNALKLIIQLSHLEPESHSQLNLVGGIVSY